MIGLPRLVRKVVVGAACAVGVVVVSATAGAQFRSRSDLVLAPLLGWTTPDDAHAVALNPAALPYLESWSLVYQHAEAGAEGFAAQGDSLRFAMPLFWGLAFGAAADSIRPGVGAAQGDAGAFSLALAYAPSQAWSFGTAFRFFASNDPTLAGLATADISALFRPSSMFAFSFQVRDVSGPIFGGPASAPYPAVFLFSSAFRPTGDRAVTLDLSGGVSSQGQVGVRGALEVAVPHLGRVHVAGELVDLDGDPDVVVSAGLALDWGRLGANGGAFFRSGDGGPGFYAGARLEGHGRPGIPTGAVVLSIAVRSGTGARGILALVQQLERARQDPRVSGVFLQLQGTSIGSAYAQELREALALLGEAGKPTLCHLQAASGPEFYACAAADMTLLDPAGGVRLEGVSGNAVLLGDLMQRVGLRADFVRIGAFKSAVEQFENTTLSDPAQHQRQNLYDQIHAQQVRGLAEDLALSERALETLLDDGPFLTPDALEHGLVAGQADGAELERQVGARFFGATLTERLPTRPAEQWREDYLGVAVVDGEIVDGENVDLPLPLIGMKMSGSQTLVQTIDALAGDPRCRAIVLRVDSPGGSALASDQIWRAVTRARRRKPVVASLGAVAASGGYYVASAASEVFASPATITGSIGIFAGKIDVAGLAQRIGVGLEHFQSARHAGLDSFYRPYTPEERALVADMIRTWYRLFLRRVADGRGMSVGDIHEVAEGRIWSGEAAVRRGLVDELGGFAKAARRARELAGLAEEAPVRLAPARPSGWVDLVLQEVFATSPSLGAGGDLPGESSDAEREVIGIGSDGDAFGSLGPELQRVVSFLMMAGRVQEGIPQARLEGYLSVP